MSGSETCPTCGREVNPDAGAVRMTGEFTVPSPAELARMAADSGQAPVGDAPRAMLPHAGADVCSWCGKPGAQVKKLLTGPGVQICNECVALCHMILRDELPGYG